MINNLKTNKNKKGITIPILDIYALGCGIYVGYAHKNGIDINYDFYALSPSILSLGSSYLTFKFLDYTYKKITEVDLNDESINLKDKSGKKIDLSKLSLEEKIEFENKYYSSMNKLKKNLSFKNRNKQILKNTTKTSIETGIGYLIGRVLF